LFGFVFAIPCVLLAVIFQSFFLLWKLNWIWGRV